MCHIEYESSWTINVKLSFVLPHLPIGYLAGMPECSLEFLLETTSWGVVLIHFNFLSISLLSFHLPPEGELMVISGSGYKPRMTWGCLLCTVPVRGCPHSRSPGGRKGSWGRMKNRAAAERKHETLPKAVLQLRYRAVIFQARQRPREEKSLGLGWQVLTTQAH